MKYTVERIVGKVVVLEKEDLTYIEVDISSLPSGVKEGNILVFDDGKYDIDTDAEAEVKKRITDKQRFIFKKNNRD